MTGLEHRIPIPAAARPLVMPGDDVRPDDAVATSHALGEPVAVPVAARLRCDPADGARHLVGRPGTAVRAREKLAAWRGREVRSPIDGVLVGYARTYGVALVAPLGADVPVVGHVRGSVAAVEPTEIVVSVPAARLAGVHGSGDAVHGQLMVGVRTPGDELRAGQVDVSATGRIVVGGSRASAETLARARAMGIAGIVLGGILDKELRDFTAIQERREKMGGLAGSFALLLVEGYGKVGLDPDLFGWLRDHEGHEASLFATDGVLYVYDAAPPPPRRVPARAGDRVVVHRRPHQGSSGQVVRIFDELLASGSGLLARHALVTLDDGARALVALANLEAVGSRS
ncbi:MAG: hypothetical protein M3295_07580 [Chloroflexota bacterium]|nr:hypothetical protein [Chloroflexota bacterium]